MPDVLFTNLLLGLIRRAEELLKVLPDLPWGEDHVDLHEAHLGQLLRRGLVEARGDIRDVGPRAHVLVPTISPRLDHHQLVHARDAGHVLLAGDPVDDARESRGVV